VADTRDRTEEALNASYGSRIVVGETPLRSTKFGLVPEGDGWFVLNARETRWRDYGPMGANCDFEGKRPFKELGINLNVLNPGEPMGMYHRENHQEGFLVLAGECLLIVEGEERPLKTWDYFHCPGGTAHTIVGAGTGPSVVLAVGARGGRKGILYLVDEAALRHDAGSDVETKRSAEAYARFPGSARSRYREGWLPESDTSGRGTVEA
jgi:uncharacterized cupin superfamily protein